MAGDSNELSKYLKNKSIQLKQIQKQDKGILRRAIKQVCVDKWRIDFPRTPARRFELSGVNSVIHYIKTELLVQKPS